MPNTRHSSENDVADILIGAAAGCLIGAATVFLTPKINFSFFQHLSEAYQIINGETESKGQEAFKCAQKAYSFAKDLANLRDIYNAPSSLAGKDFSSAKTKVLIGAIAGGILGTSALIYLNGKSSPHDEKKESSKNDRHDSQSEQSFLENAKEQVKSVNWSDILAGFVETLHEKINHNSEESTEETKAKIPFEHQTKEIVEWVTLGFDLWKTIQKRR